MFKQIINVSFSEIIIILFFGLFSNSSFAIDTFDLNTGKLTLQSVSVGSSVYSNVIVTVGNVNSIGNAPATGSNDTFNLTDGSLNIPTVLVGGSIYNNVNITLGSITSVGGGPFTQSYQVSGSVTGLNQGQSLILTDNNSDPLTVIGAQNLTNPNFAGGFTTFAFKQQIPYLGSYQVAISRQPSGQICSVNNGTGVGVTSKISI